MRVQFSVSLGANNRKLPDSSESFSEMTDLEPCLSGCDQALAEAELLIASLEHGPARLDVELSGLRDRIATLRREVERLRGMGGASIRKRIEPNWTEVSGSESPWCPPRDGAAEQA